MYREFDWKAAEENRSPRITAWLKEHHAEKIDEQEFIPQMKLLYRLGRAEGRYSHLNKRKFHQKVHGGKLRKNYNYLKKEFGFFLGV